MRLKKNNNIIIVLGNDEFYEIKIHEKNQFNSSN